VNAYIHNLTHANGLMTIIRNFPVTGKLN